MSDKETQEFTRTHRREYKSDRLDESNLPAQPLELFEAWYQMAISLNETDPNAMILSTVSADGWPSGRIVLLRSYDADGLCFYTNYESHKGKDIDTNPKVSLAFYWASINKQVRITGYAEKTTQQVSSDYFKSRPIKSQLSAWASPQSEQISDRQDLENRLQAIEERFNNEAIDCPPFWGGYLVKPRSFEFWQGRENRLHDRIRYDLNSAGDWDKYRVAP